MNRSIGNPPVWHALSAADAIAALESDSNGLTQAEAARRAETFGPNALATGAAASPWRILLHQFTSPLIYVLIVAMVVTLAIAHYADAIVIGAVLLLNAVIGFIQEYRAENAMQALLKMVAPQATVRRAGERFEIDAAELVPGDIVLLESGDQVPADLRLLEATQLQTDDSMLTGESAAASKTAAPIDAGRDLSMGDRRNMVFMGTAVLSGRARAVVVATGARTQIGLIAREVRSTERATTPLQDRIQRFGNRISVAILGVSALAFAVGLLRGISVADMFLTAVAIAVSAIPEGLPVVMTVALAVSVRRMARRNAIIRRLPAVETLGSCTVIVSDKTGTLTENRMTVQSIWAGGERYRLTGAGLSARGDLLKIDNGEPTSLNVDPWLEGSVPPIALALLAGMLANESDVRRHPHHRPDGATIGGAEDELVGHGDPTEVALLVAAMKAGLSRESWLDDWPAVEQVPFESERQYSASIHRNRERGTVIALLKGAPERVAEMCDRVLMRGGEQPIDHSAIAAEARRLAGEGIRMLGMAMSREADAIDRVRRSEPSGLVFLGLVGMMDPPREGVTEAVERCRRAGIRVVMCTGDHTATAAAIAARIGILSESEPDRESRVVNGRDLLQIDDPTLATIVQSATVYARMNPTQKLRIVRAMRDQDEVVAVTGDGVNDAPALKAAHLGCAMGRSGTDVAREASEMVLADDNFATIYAAVEEGRTAFSNIRKATNFLIAGAIGMMLAILGTFLLGMPIPLLPAQILWLNVVTNGIQDVAMAFEPGERQLFTQPPRDTREGLISPRLLEQSVLVGALFALVALMMFWWETSHGATEAYARSAVATMLVVFLALHVGNCRSEAQSILRKSPFSNPVLFIGTAVSVLVHLGAMHFGPTQTLLGLEPLSRETWMFIITVAPSVLVLVELHKFLRIRRKSPARPRRRSGDPDTISSSSTPVPRKD